MILLTNFGLSECVAVEFMTNHWIIDSYTAMADVNPDGSVSVEEYITYEFTKDFSGVLRRRIDTFTASSIDGISILEVVDIDEEDIAKSKLKQLESDSYEIIFDEEYDMVSGIDISFDQTDKKRTLVFRYTLYDLISIYSDMALLDWSFLDRGNSPSVRDISVNVCIPKSEDIESMQSFLQGPLYSQKLNKEKAVDFEASLLNGDEDLRLILLLPTSMVPEGRKKIDNEIAEKVLVEMQEYEREIELVRKEYERQQLTIKLLTYISGGLILAALVYLYIKYDRDPKQVLKNLYQ